MILHSSIIRSRSRLATDNTPWLLLSPNLTLRPLRNACACCSEALELFVSAYGAECGNLALRAVTTRGLYVGGGIAPKILPALQSGRFLDSFRDKPPMRDLLESIPVKVILNPHAGLLGAAVFANAEVM